MIRRSPQGHPSRVRAKVAQMLRAMKGADKQSKNTFAEMCTGFGKVDSDPGEEAVIKGTTKELRKRNLEQCLAMKKEMPCDIQDVWQIIENLLEELQRLEEETKPRFTAQTRVNRVLTHLALSGHERADVLKDSSSAANSLDQSRRSGDAHARREAFLTRFDSRLGNDDEPCSSRDGQVNAPAVQVVQQTVEDPQATHDNTVMDAMIQKVQITHEAPQLQFIDDIEDGRCSQTEIDRMAQEGERHRDEDEPDAAKIEAKSRLENNCVSVQNTLTEEKAKDKFEAGDKEKVIYIPVVVQRQVPMTMQLRKTIGTQQISENVQKTVEIPKVQVVDKVVHIPVNSERNAPTIQSAQKMVEIPRVQYIDKVADIPVDVQRQVSTIQASQHDMQHIDEVVHVPALIEGEVPTIPDADDPCLDENADEDQLEHENKKRRLPMPAEAASESRADESDFDRFNDLVLPSPEGKTLFVNIESGYEAEDGPEKEQEMTRSLVQGGVHAGGRDRRAKPRTRVGPGGAPQSGPKNCATCGRWLVTTWLQK